MAGEVGEALRLLIAERAWQVCEYCLVHEGDLYHGCEVDHIRSRKHGGENVSENLAFACFHCNRHKGTDLGSVSARTGALVRFFHPRSDRWREHFGWNEGRIEPLTARLLEFNHPERVALRRALAETGRYPSVEALALVRG